MGAKKEIRTVQSRQSPFLLVRILPGKNHPKVFCSQGTGGPCAAPNQGRPEPQDVDPGLVDDQRVSRQRPASRSCLGPPGFPCGSDEQRTVRLKLSGTLAFRQPFPGSCGHIPCPEGWGMPASCACQLEAFRSVPFDRFRHRPLSGERATARTDAPMLPRQRRPKPVVGVPLSIRIRTSPSGRRAPPILRVPFRPRTARCRLRDPGQVVFRSHPFGLPLGINAIQLPEPPGRTLCRSVGLSLLTPQGWGRNLNGPASAGL